MKKLLILLMILFISVCYALEEVDIFDISGKYIYSTEINYPEKSEDIIIVNSNFLYEFEKCDSKLSNGIYIVSKSKNGKVLKSNNFNRDFGFEDITNSVFPVQESVTGDLVVKDINGDNKDDIIFSQFGFVNLPEDNRIRIWIQTEDGLFIDETNERMPLSIINTLDIEIFDIDNDGDLDIFSCSTDFENCEFPANIFINDGLGFFTDESEQRLPTLEYNQYVFFAESGRIDNDDDIDLVLTILTQIDSYFRYLPMLWLNDGNGYFYTDSAGRLPIENYGYFEIAISDVNLNGLNDIVFCNIGGAIYDQNGNLILELSGQNSCYINTGDGFFIDETENRMPTFDISTRHITCSDIDNDNDLDILEAHLYWEVSEYTYRILYNDGNGFFEYNLNTMPNINGHFNDSVVSLFNDDNYPDIFITKVDLGVEEYDILLLNNGDGTFYDGTDFLPVNLDFSVACDIFDYETDNDIDLVIGNTGSGELTFYGQNLLYGNEIDSNNIEEELLPINGSLFINNYPNPFNPSTTIEFSIQNDSDIDLSIYNIKGQKIKALANEHFSKGSNSVIWDGDDENNKPVSSGIYYYKLNVNGKTETVKKCLLLK